MVDIVIVPDVHGRKFWQDAIPYIQNGTPVVFLGDYLDPYAHEGITPEMAIDNFMDILRKTEGHDNVTLLAGNHDMTYIAPEANICECRTDYEHFDELHHLFTHNAHRFRLVHQVRRDMSVPPVTFSHAGIHPGWLKLIKDNWAEDAEVMLNGTLEDILKLDKHGILTYLSHVSRERGGWNKYGSVVWADIHEFQWDDELWPGLQVVGHTQQLKKEPTEGGWWKWVGDKPVRVQNVVCLDCHQCFYLDPDMDIRYLKDDKVVD